MGHNILLTVSFGVARFGCGKQSLASLGVASISSGRPYRPDDPDQQDRADPASPMAHLLEKSNVALSTLRPMSG